MAAKHVRLVIYCVEIFVSEDFLYDKNIHESC